MNPREKQYKLKILKELAFGKVLSSNEISLGIERSIPLTSRILADMVAEGSLREMGLASSTGGRRPMMYALAGGRHYAISVAMDQVITHIGLVDLYQNTIIKNVKHNIPLTANPQAVNLLSTALNNFVDSLTMNKSFILGVGIGMPGFIDLQKGVNQSFLDTGSVSLVEYLQEEIRLPVYIDNDSSLIALAESKLGMAKEFQNCMVINLNWGVGLGLILNGTLYRGQNGFAGEFSHIPLFENNKLCSCGKTGCLQTETSMQVIIDKAREQMGKGKATVINRLSDDFEEASMQIIDAGKKGDGLVVELISDAAFHIGRGISTLIHILNPEAIVLSGRGALAGNLWLAPVHQALHLYCIPQLARHTRTLVSDFGAEAGLVGGAALVAENLGKMVSMHTERAAF